MIEKNVLKYDPFRSTFGWRINLKAEFDYRQEPWKGNVMVGFSAYDKVPEMKNKEQLLLLCVCSLFEKRYVYKSAGILIYRAVPDRLLREFSNADIILHIAKDGDCVDLIWWNDFENAFIEDNINKMAKHYNSGYQRNVPLRIVK
jgi:hypothetical protein